MRNFGIAASTHASNDTLKSAVGWIVDDPATLSIFVDLLDFRFELRLLVQTVGTPDLGDLLYDLLTIGVPALPLNAWVESIPWASEQLCQHEVINDLHDGVYLKARGVVDFGPDTSQSLTAASFEDGNIEAMADAMRGRRHTGQAGANDSDSRATKIRMWRRWCRGEHPAEDVLKQVVEEVEGSIEPGAEPLDNEVEEGPSVGVGHVATARAEQCRAIV